MKNKNKKGFTLVELLVVIAILAILASVTVVGYTGFTKKANLSNDQQMIKMINDNLLATSVEKKPTTASEALTNLYGVGFSPEKLMPFSKDYHYSYNLKTNKMYLLDDNDTVAFPKETVDNKDMWGFYRNDSSDKLTNINNYIAMQSITDQNTFEKVFKDAKYKIDLNNFLINVDGNDQIEVSNGSVAPGKNFANGDQTVEKKLFRKSDDHNYDNDLEVEIIDNVLTVKDYYVYINKDRDKEGTLQNNYFSSSVCEKSTDEITTVILKDIVFDGNDGGEAYLPNIYTHGESYSNENMNTLKDKISKIIIDGCKFINFGSWSLELADSYKQYEVRNCEFVNTARGITITPVDNNFERRMYTSGSIIENNSFRLTAVEKDDKTCIRPTYLWDYNVDGAGEDTLDIVLKKGPLYTIRNNNLLSANQLVFIHNTVSKTPNVKGKEYESYANFKVMSNDQMKKAFIIENNNIKDKNASLVAINESKYSPEELVIARGHLNALLGNN